MASRAASSLTRRGGGGRNSVNTAFLGLAPTTPLPGDNRSRVAVARPVRISESSFWSFWSASVVDERWFGGRAIEKSRPENRRGLRRL